MARLATAFFLAGMEALGIGRLQFLQGLLGVGIVDRGEIAHDHGDFLDRPVAVGLGILGDHLVLMAMGRGGKAAARCRWDRPA